MPSYYRKPKGQRYYIAILDVPQDVRKILGKTQFKKSLRTEDEKTAARLSAQIVPKWEEQIQAARKHPQSEAAKVLEEHRRLVRSLKEQIAKAKTDADWNNLTETLGVIENEIQDIVEAKFPDDEDSASMAYKLVTGKLTELTGETLNRYLKTSTTTEKTKDDIRRSVIIFSEHEAIAQRVNKDSVAAFVRAMLDAKKAKGTIKKRLSYLGGYWEWLRDYERVLNAEAQNPFRGVRIGNGTNGGGKAARSTERKPFTVEDLQKLHEAMLRQSNRRGEADMLNVFLIACYTGMRIEEACRLTTQSIDLDRQTITVLDAKTKAGDRVIPIHSRLLPLIKRLTATASPSGLLIDTGSQNKFGNLSDPISKRFGRLKTSLGYDGRFVFHSIRKTVATLLEQAGVPEGIAADVLGHEKQTMSYGLYSGGSSLTQKREAIAKLDLGFEPQD
jgi:integrase